MNAFGVPIYVSKAPSMKVPPKRKGNHRIRNRLGCFARPQ